MPLLDHTTILLLPFLAGLLIIATHIPLGTEVLRRGIIFIDLAIAQIAGLGIVVASSLFHDAPIAKQLFALCFALAAAYLFSLYEKKLERHLEAIIGTAYALSSAAALIIAAHDPHGMELIHHLLSGQLLWVDQEQLLAYAVLSIIALGLMCKRERLKRLFYPIFALTIMYSVQLAGVFLVFATLVIPALMVRITESNAPYKTAYAIAGFAFLSGLITAHLADLPTGPVLVCSLGVIGMGYALVRNVGAG